MSSRTFLTIACLVIVASLLGVRAEAQSTYCLTPATVPQPPPPPSSPPICEPKPCETCMKSPCYVATGVYATDAVDLTIPTAGTFSLVASRLYDSSRVVDGPLGLGWSSSLTPRLYYATYLVAAPSTYSHEADIVMPDGVLYRFTTDGSGAFSPPAGRYDKLVKNGDGSYTLTLQHTRTAYAFTADGSVSSLTDDFGNVITWTYDSSGRVQQVADSAGSGRYINLTWGPDGRVSTLTDNSGRQVKYYYDSTDGTLAGVADPTVSGNASLRSTNYTYAAGRFGKVLTRISDRWSVISALQWYSDGKLKSYTDGAYNDASPATSAGEKYTYVYNQQSTDKSSSLGTISYGYDATGLVNPPYYANGQPTSVTSPTGGQSQLVYDALGRVATVTKPSPEPSSSGNGTAVWWYTYDPSWPEQVASITAKDTAGNLKTNWAGWRYDYNGAGAVAPGALANVWRVRSDTVTTDLVASYGYTAHGRLANVTDYDNAVMTAYGYNAAGDLISITTPGAPSVTQITYDVLGRPLSVTDPNGHTTVTTYDALDRIISVTLPKPSVTSTYDTVTTYSYDNYDSASGLTFTNTTDANGHITKVGYDALGHVEQTIDAAGNVTQFTYQYDLLQKIRDANGNETSYGYSTTRELASMTYPDGAVETYNSSNGVLFGRTDRLGHTIQYAYDGLGRVVSALYPGLPNNYGGTIGQYYRYDGQKLVELDDDQTASFTIHNYSYDSSWRLAADAVIGGETKTYTYPGNGSLIASYTIQPPSGTTSSPQTVSYSYDPRGQVASEMWSWLPSGQFTFDYTPSGQYNRMTFPNGQQRRFAYDNQDRLTNITNTSPSGDTIASFDYGYDYDWPTNTYSMRGQRTSVSVTAPGAANIVSGLTRYSYDASYQLVRADYPNNTADAWTYDAIGNRTSRRLPNYGLIYPYTYYTNASGGNTQRLRNDTSSNISFTYDAAGNLTGDYGVANAYGWDYAGRLLSYGGNTYTYDAFGRTSTSTSGSTTRYISINGHTVSERNTTLGVATDYLFGRGMDEPLAKRTANGNISYFGVDGLGSVVVSTDLTGAVFNSTGYSPWGETPTSPPELFGYAGRETGGPAWYNRARYYDAGRGRFISEDPLYSGAGRFKYVLETLVTSGMEMRGQEKALHFEHEFDVEILKNGGTASLYAYALGNPIMNTDPDGLGVMGRANPLCWYWIWRCSGDSGDCRKDWECKLKKMDEEQQYETLTSAGVSSESGFYYKKCFLGQPSCVSMLTQCGRPPNPGQWRY